MVQSTLLVTGGAGFIGSHFVLNEVARGRHRVVSVDKLTYAGNLENTSSLAAHDSYVFVRADICDRKTIADLLRAYDIGAIVNFAAESHVDRSIDGPDTFVRTNVVGAFELLEAARSFHRGLPAERASAFRFVQVSTDEVYGSLGAGNAFAEGAPYAPSSPYAASKAGADHLVHAYHQTYGLPTLTTHCSNNYGPFQFPDKLVPLMILNALEERPLPLYGDGQHVRDWLFVADHCDAIQRVLEHGRAGQTYNIGGRSERTNLEMVLSLCELLDELEPRKVGRYRDLIAFVADRPGHDRRYAIDPTKIERELGWRPRTDFASGSKATVEWYLGHRDWCDRITRACYARERLGLAR